MFRIAIFTASLMLANVCSASDMLSIAFEDSSIMFEGNKVKCDLYYILLGDNGSLESGDLVQVVQLHDDRKRFGIEKGRFSRNSESNDITVRWQAVEGEKFGAVEKARLLERDANTSKMTYEIYQHDDQSQVGQKLRVRLVDFQQLPDWVQNAVRPSITAKLSPEAQMLIHQMQAAQIRNSAEIIQMYLSILD